MDRALGDEEVTRCACLHLWRALRSKDKVKERLDAEVSTCEDSIRKEFNVLHMALQARETQLLRALAACRESLESSMANGMSEGGEDIDGPLSVSSASTTPLLLFSSNYSQFVDFVSGYASLEINSAFTHSHPTRLSHVPSSSGSSSISPVGPVTYSVSPSSSTSSLSSARKHHSHEARYINAEREARSFDSKFMAPSSPAPGTSSIPLPPPLSTSHTSVASDPGISAPVALSYSSKQIIVPVPEAQAVDSACLLPPNVDIKEGIHVSLMCRIYRKRSCSVSFAIWNFHRLTLAISNSSAND